MSDLTLSVDNGYLNIRVGAIIMKNGKVLMVTNYTADYYYSVGGRIRFMERIEDAVVREVFEETGVKLEIDRLGFIHENYFLCDSGAKKGKPMHELSFFFYMKTPKDFEPKNSNVTEDGIEEKLKWVDVNNTDAKFFPRFFATELHNPSKNVKIIYNNDIVEK